MTQVLIDGRALTDHSSRRGIGTYLRGLLREIGTLDDLRATVLRVGDTPPIAGVTWRDVPRMAPGRFGDLEHRVRSAWDVARIEHDLFHSTSQDPPLVVRGRWVQTLHGLAPLAIKDDGFAHERQLWQRRAKAYRRADAVIAVSQFCAEDGIERLGLDPARVHAVAHGVDESFRVVEPSAPADPPYLLFVGEYGIGKGHNEAFAATASLAEMGFPHRLKVVGHRAPWYQAPMAELVRCSERPERIELAGYISTGLPRIYREAAALIVTSRYESFGLPALEAMASGIPVVSYDNSALREVIGDGGVLVPTGDMDRMVAELAALLTDAEMNMQLRKRAMARAAGFSWARSAVEHLSVYRRAAA